MANTPNVPTTLTSKDVRAVKFYISDIGRFGTASTWKGIGLAPVQGAISTEMTTSQGYNFNLFHESQVDTYDADAEKRKREAIKALKKERDDAFNAFLAHEIDQKQLDKAEAEIRAKLTALMS